MKSERCKCLWLGKAWSTVMLLMVGCGILDYCATANEDKKPHTQGIVSTIWALQKDDENITVMPLHGDRIRLTLQPETLIAGMCVHCNMVMEIKAGQNAKNCTKCACNCSNSECFVNKVAGKNGWAEMLKALPKGTVLLVEYLKADKPESGLKRLTIDHRTALLPIRSASAPSIHDLTVAAKTVGGTNVELGCEGKRLLIHLKDDWTQAKETRLLKSLSQIGVEMDFSFQEAFVK